MRARRRTALAPAPAASRSRLDQTADPHTWPSNRAPNPAPRALDCAHSAHSALVVAVNRSYNSHIRRAPPGSSNWAFDRHRTHRCLRNRAEWCRST